ncbi:hypothetical protein H5T87_05455 [bacterium]|nr:hypothetical protein [bacterium]
MKDWNKRENREAKLVYEGIEFRLRELKNAVDLAGLFQKTRLYSDGLRKFRLSNGEEIELPGDLAVACLWVEAHLVEPKMSFQELVEMSLHTGPLIFILLEKALEISGMLGWEKDFFRENGEHYGGK